MSSADALARRLADSPALPTIVARMQALLEAETQRRHAFLDELDPSAKAEFINGDVILHSPARAEHVEITRRLTILLGAYVQAQQLGKVMVGKALVSLTRNDYKPDVCFFGAAKSAAVGPQTLRLPAPDLAVEVLSPSSEARDRGVKMDDYAAHGVAEYWIVDADAQTVEQYVLGPNDRFALDQTLSGQAVLTSVAVEGFSAPAAALFNDRQNLEALRSLLG